MRSKLAVFVCLALLLTVAVVPQAVADTIRSGFNAYTLPGNDDGSTGQINLGSFGMSPLNFWGYGFSSLWVNNNGNLTFNGGMSTYTPYGLQTTTRPIIAPFFADVDTRASADVTYGGGTVNGHNAFAANYVDVGYYSYGSDKLNSFQVVLVDRADTGSGNFDIEFNYDQVQWETGSASGGWGGLGGSSAHVGWNNGAGAYTQHGQELIGSGVNGAFLDGGLNSLVTHSLGTTTPGRYIWEVRNTAGVGQTQGNPIMPSWVSGGVWYFYGANSGNWFDPVMAYGYEYDMTTPGAYFTGLTLPDGYSGLTVDWGTDSMLASSGSYIALPSGVDHFTVTGIDPPKDPNDTSAFPTYLTFSQSPVDFTMSPLTRDYPDGQPIPEPATLTLFGLGSLGLAAWRRRR